MSQTRVEARRQVGDDSSMTITNGNGGPDTLK